MNNKQIVEQVIKESYAKHDYRIRYKQAEDMMRDLMLKALEYKDKSVVDSVPSEQKEKTI